MAAKSVLDTKEMQDLLSENSNKVIADFLSHYIGHVNYQSAVHKMLYELGKVEVEDLNYFDYQKIIDEDNKTAQDRYVISFFKYLYAFNLMKNQEGFDWGNKQTIIKKFINQKIRSKQNQSTSEDDEENKEASLSLHELMSIQSFVSQDYSKLEILKMVFCWHMLFENDCSVGEIKELTSDDFNDGYITTSKNQTFYVPEKFHILFNILGERTYKGFQTINDLIEQFGVLVGIEKLTPIRIKKARKENMMTCGNCGKDYTNLLNNWISVYNRIICISCSESLKKKEPTIMVENLRTTDFELLPKDLKREVDISSIVFTFDELRTKVSMKENDYLKLHKFQMEIGKLGEAFVYELEQKKLKGTMFEELVDIGKASDPKNGYDILSYDLSGNKLHIEVKTTAKNNDEFFLTDTELNTAKQMKADGEKYLIYRVSNIFAKNKNEICCEVITDIIEDKNYEFEEKVWKVKCIR